MQKNAKIQSLTELGSQLYCMEKLAVEEPGTEWAHRFRAVQPGVSLHLLAREIRAMAKEKARKYEKRGTPTPDLPKVQRLRTMLFYDKQPANPEAHVFLESILENLLKKLEKNPAYLDGKIPVDVENLVQIVTWIQEEQALTVREVLGVDLPGYREMKHTVTKGLKSRDRAPFRDIEEQKFHQIAANLNAAVAKILDEAAAADDLVQKRPSDEGLSVFEVSAK